ncbi:MAG: right-handed parallel beta-helix repeat-containing protein [Planctomycetaceae bacterium]|nr:right-handed parallel beta-helix repeat-containing protein [Planctomycetaceae bacterium]
MSMSSAGQLTASKPHSLNHQPPPSVRLMRTIGLALLLTFSCSPASLRADQKWVPPGAEGNSTPAATARQALTAPAVTITSTPKPTADVSEFTREYIIELERFEIDHTGQHPVETSRGINRALQHAKTIKANRIVFPPGTYLISETDPIILDHQNTIIDLNGATLQINTNDQPKYAIVEIVDGAENLRLTDGFLKGDRDQHDYSSNHGAHEWGHGLIVTSGRNLEIDHLTVTNVTGDGANSRMTGARTRPELLARINHSLYRKHLEPGRFSAEGTKIDSAENIRTIEPLDITRCGGEFEFGYSTGYLGYPFIRSRVYRACFYDADRTFLEDRQCLQFRKVQVPANAAFVHLEFEQPSVPEEPVHAGAGRGSFVGRISSFTPPTDVHFHHNTLQGNRRLGLGYCGGRRWLIEENLFAGNGGTAPAYGIDLEDGWEFMQDVVIRNNRFRDNVAGDLVICAGSELLIEDNVFEKNVAVHARPHNYTFRNNRFTGGNITFKTRTGVATFEGNTYENCTLSIMYDTSAVADGLYRRPEEQLATPPLRLSNETLLNVTRITGTYFDFDNATLKQTHFIAGDETSLVRFHKCRLSDSSIIYEAADTPVRVDFASCSGELNATGPGQERRQFVGQSAP